MKFYSLAGEASRSAALAEEYKSGGAVGAVRLGKERLFFRAGMKIRFIPYEEIHRCYRRVVLVPARLCCGQGALEIENLVLEDGAGQSIQIQLPGSRAGKILLERLRELLPYAEFGCPPKAGTT